MATLDDVYRKFGEASEAAQLLETELGTILIQERAHAQGLIANRDPDRVAELFEEINRATLGRILKSLEISGSQFANLAEKLDRALTERNRLAHSFFRQHNLRRNSEDGRASMYRDLETIHSTILAAYKSVLLASSGIDLEKAGATELPTKHLPL